MIMPTEVQHLSPEAAQIILNTLPEKIQLGLRAYAAQIEYPIELVIEMMIAGFLDEDAISFEGCQPLRDMNFVKLAS
jgi:hypothetical protein